jgi:molecular chaperone GrpE
MSEPHDKELDATSAEPAAPEAEDAAVEAIPEGAPEEADGEPEEPSPLDVVSGERDEFKERWLRAAAELENVRKRSRRDVTDARRFAQADVLRSLLDVADNFERALGSMAGDEATVDSVREGVELIHQRFQSVLRDRGVEVIEALGAEFDPNCHEALGQIASEGTSAGTVVEVAQQGYRFGDLVLRPARVIIAS